MFTIELLGSGWQRAFVKGYNNTLACLNSTPVQEQAKVFGSEEEATKWAKAYLPAYKWKLTPIVP